MKNRGIAAGMLFLSFCVPVSAYSQDEDAVFDKFLQYTAEVYLSSLDEALRLKIRNIHVVLASGWGRRVVGYSLGNLLKYARRGTENHKTWLMLERQTKDRLFEVMDSEGELLGLDRDFVETSKRKAWQECMAAQQGWMDEAMAVFTNVRATDAPNFFDSLAAGDEPANLTNPRDLNTGREVQPGQDIPTPVSDEILGTWRWTHEYRIPSL